MHRPQVQRADLILHCCKRVGVEGAEEAPFSLQDMLDGALTHGGLAPDHCVQPLWDATRGVAGVVAVHTDATGGVVGGFENGEHRLARKAK